MPDKNLDIAPKRLSFLPYELLAGVTAGFFVSPFNTIVDKSVI